MYQCRKQLQDIAAMLSVALRLLNFLRQCGVANV
jgi:hypothetical protein